MKKYILALLFIIPIAHAKNCEDWLNENYSDMTGVDIGIVWNESRTNWVQLFSTAYGTFDFNDRDDINAAKFEAKLMAKAELVKFMTEEINTVEGMSKVTTKRKNLSATADGTEVQVNNESIKKVTNNIVSNSSGLIKGILTLCEHVDKDNKEVQVIVGVSEKTINIANDFNRKTKNNKSSNNRKLKQSKSKIESETRKTKNTDF